MPLNTNAAFDRYSDAAPLWCSPDMSVLASGRRDAPRLPKKLFGPLWSMLEEISEGTGGLVDYPAMALLAVGASLIGGKRRIRPYKEVKWSEPSILWVGLVGDASSKKSPGVRYIIEPLREIERDKADNHNEDLLQWRGDTERAKAEWASYQGLVKEAANSNLPNPPVPASAEEPLQPQRRRLLVQDTTPEMLQQILSGNPSGTLHYRDELDGWLQSFDRYAPGGRSFWLEAYGGDAYTSDRKGGGATTLIFNGVSVVGGIQPDKLAEGLMTQVNDGLAARLLWAWPQRPAYRRPRRCGDQNALRTMFERLENLAWATDEEGNDKPIVLTLDEQAADIYSAFEEENHNAGDQCPGLYQSFRGKAGGTLLRLALVSEMTRWAFEGGGPEPTTVKASTIAAAAEFIEDYAKPSALRVFGDVAVPAVERHAATLARYIQQQQAVTINARELKRTARLPGMREAGPLNEAIAFLVEANWLREAGTRRSETAGRASSDFSVNPLVHGGSNGKVG